MLMNVKALKTNQCYSQLFLKNFSSNFVTNAKKICNTNSKSLLIHALLAKKAHTNEKISSNADQQNFPKAFKKSNNKTGFDYRMYLYRDENCSEKMSFWHDIPYKNSDSANTFNCIYEVPFGEAAKMEMSKEEFNPIKQDTKKKKFTNEEYLRYYKLLPIFNYGFIPQTWENSEVKYRNIFVGDNDPLDVIELSLAKTLFNPSTQNASNNTSYVSNSRVSIGDISRIHVIGSFCLIDQDEVDWKVLALNADNFTRDQALKWMSHEENSLRLKEILNWFKIYKTFEGKKENTILDNDKIFSIEETFEIIEENHKHYKDFKKI